MSRRPTTPLTGCPYAWNRVSAMEPRAHAALGHDRITLAMSVTLSHGGLCHQGRYAERELALRRYWDKHPDEARRSIAWRQGRGAYSRRTSTLSAAYTTPRMNCVSS
jgi:hypothetical protein